MKRRSAPEPELTRVSEVKVTVMPLRKAVRMVTLYDPTEGLQEARGAFVRLDPPKGHPPDETASWRLQAAAVALAVRVLPTRRDAPAPVGLSRPGGDYGADVRAEAIAIAREMNDPDVLAAVEEFLAEAG